jgi:hypothetical protein
MSEHSAHLALDEGIRKATADLLNETPDEYAISRRLAIVDRAIREYLQWRLPELMIGYAVECGYKRSRDADHSAGS